MVHARTAHGGTADAAMSPCPASWNASTFGCIRITTVELLHHECVDYCGMQNASLYCVRSAEQHALVSDLLDDFARTEEVARVGEQRVAREPPRLRERLGRVRLRRRAERLPRLGG